MSYDTEALLELDVRHLVHPNHTFGEPAEVILTGGKGIRLFDSEGNSYIDARSQLSCANLGYGHPKLIEAMKKQLDELQYASIFYQFTHPQAVKAAERIIESAPTGLQHIMFTSGGSEAVESALNLALLYWARVGETQKTKVISRYGAYHGATSLAATVSGLSMGGFDGMITRSPGIIHGPAVDYAKYGAGLEPEEYTKQVCRQLVEVIEAEGPDTIAAFIGEPVLGAGGHIPPPPGYWQAIRQICDEYSILLILDEVMTGFHRTGPRFASEHWSIAPDIMAIGKGMNASYVPCGAAVFSARIGQAIQGSKLTGHTHSGHPLAMAAINATFDIIEEDQIPALVDHTSRVLMDRLRQEFEPLAHVGSVGGLGLMANIELVQDKKSCAPLPDTTVQQGIVRRGLRNGLIVRASKGRVALSPPLISSEAEIHEILDKMYMLVSELE